jgi:hypothetical protein
MAIHEQQNQQVNNGFAKQIDEGAARMLLDNFQKDQYSYPEKSTIRELVSNGIDAIRERDIAVSILRGQSKVEDHYVVKEGPEYKDSKFDHSYYDLTWLAEDPYVYITYKEGSQLEKDKLIIRDNGVGLGGKRLMGYFSLAYSTKRLSTFGLGKFGMGAKAALSTGVPYYVVKNRYNGVETWWNVYSYQVEPSIPKFDMATGKENLMMILDNGMSIYYKETHEPNGLEVSIDVKKHHKQKYIDAIQSQLLYFDHISFFVESYDGKREEIEINAPIIYENDIMILSDNNFFTKPHILVNRVNYGLIDFQELELEEKIGNISIKLKPEEVSVSPNRERVIWDDMTAGAIKKRFKEVQESAERLLQGELEQSDFLKWLKTCVTIRNKMGTEQSNTIVGRLSKLVDLDQYEPVYKVDPEFKVNKFLFAGVRARKISLKKTRVGSSYTLDVDRSPVGLADLVELPILIQREDTNWLKDRYLLEDIYQDGFVTIQLNKTEFLVAADDVDEIEQSRIRNHNYFLKGHAKETAIDLKWLVLQGDAPDTIYLSKVDLVVPRVLERWKKFNQYILASEGIQFYEDIEVPENFKDRNKHVKENETAVKQEAEVQTEEARLSAEARRKLNGTTVLFTPRVEWNRSNNTLYTWHKLEIPVMDIDKWNDPEIYYSSDNDSSLLQLAAFITRPEEGQITLKPYTGDPNDYGKDGSIHRSYNHGNYEYHTTLPAFHCQPEVKLIKVAQNRVKYYRDFKHIQSFFADYNAKTKTLTMSNKLIKWNTARYIHQYLPRLKFLNNFRAFDDYMWTTYHNLVKYHNQHYREVGDHAGKIKEIGQVEYGEMISHMDKVAELQIFVAEHPSDSAAIVQMVKGLFGTEVENIVQDGCALDMNLRNLVHKLLDYAEPLYVMLNEMEILTNCDDIMTQELEDEIRGYIKFKTGI